MRRLIAGPGLYRRRAGRRLRARAGDRRRNHEGGQGHRRLRAAVNFRRLWPRVRRATIWRLLPAATVGMQPGATMSSKRRSYEAGHKPQISGRHRRHDGMRPRGLFGGAARRPHRVGRGDAARDRARRPQPAVARRRRHHAGRGDEAANKPRSTNTPRAPRRSPSVKADRVIREGDDRRGDHQADRRGRGHRHPGARPPAPARKARDRWSASVGKTAGTSRSRSPSCPDT